MAVCHPAPRCRNCSACLGDPAAIDPFLAEIGKDRRKLSEGEIDTGAAALHLAVRCASGEFVSFFGCCD